MAWGVIRPGAKGSSGTTRDRVMDQYSTKHSSSQMAFQACLNLPSGRSTPTCHHDPSSSMTLVSLGRKELVDTGKSSRTCSVPTVSLRLAALNVFQGIFGPKMAVFGFKLQFLKLRSATCESRSRPPPLSFLLKLCVIVLHTHRYHPPKFHPNLKHHDGVLIFPHFARAAAYLLLAACCLLACCLLLAAKPGRSTLDTKKGYKTKTGSTSSVTLALTPNPSRSPNPSPNSNTHNHPLLVVSIPQNCPNQRLDPRT